MSSGAILAWSVATQASLHGLAYALPTMRKALLAVSGLLWCSFAADVERESTEVVFCDLNSVLACSGILRSPQAYLLSYFNIVPLNSALDLSSSTLGIIFYTLYFLNAVGILRTFGLPLLGELLNGITLVGAWMCLPLSLFWMSHLISYRSICTVCVMIYTVNAGIILTSARELYATF